MAWNDIQQARNNLQQSELTNNEQNRTQNHQQQADFEIILMGQWVLFFNTFPIQHVIKIIGGLLYGEL